MKFSLALLTAFVASVIAVPQSTGKTPSLAQIQGIAKQVPKCAQQCQSVITKIAKEAQAKGKTAKNVDPKAACNSPQAAEVKACLAAKCNASERQQMQTLIAKFAPAGAAC